MDALNHQSRQERSRWKMRYNRQNLPEEAIVDRITLDAIVRIAHKKAEAAEIAGSGTVHVRDGKPLTAHGAKLLGAPWPR